MRTVKVDMYDAQTGRWLKSYPSIKEAAADTGICPACISNNICGRLRTVSGKKYYFRCKEVEYRAKPKSDMHNFKGFPIMAFSDDEGYLGTFQSSKEAAEALNMSRAIISYCLNGKVRRAKKKYYFKFVTARW